MKSAIGGTDMQSQLQTLLWLKVDIVLFSAKLEI